MQDGGDTDVAHLDKDSSFLNIDTHIYMGPGRGSSGGHGSRQALAPVLPVEDRR